jgi:hypothetical protein
MEQQINITFPDGAVREYIKGTTAVEVAKSISEGLAKKVIAADVNGKTWDATRPIEDDVNLKLLTWDDKGGKNTFWHSSAHLMAEAIESTFPGVKFWVGPPVDNGFYYDVDLGDHSIAEEVIVKLYDNGEIDDDTISVYLDNNLVLSSKRLSTTPLTIILKMSEDNSEHVLVMVAENLGKIPPNTSLMIVNDGDKRYEVRITSTEQKNAMVRFRYQKTIP